MPHQQTIAVCGEVQREYQQIGGLVSLPQIHRLCQHQTLRVTQKSEAALGGIYKVASSCITRLILGTLDKCSFSDQ